MTTQTCEYCDKRGVPILPLRYGVAPAGTGAPTTTGPQVALDARAAHYTRRLLRTGYLYVYDEARNRWDDYFVTADGYFFRVHNTPGIPPVLPQKPFNCPDLGHAAVASCITIPDAKRATNAWLGFSDVQWTEAVRAKHADAGYRKRHMRCVDVKAFAGSTDAAHCLSVAQVGAQVAEYAMTPGALRKALEWSPFAPSSRDGRAERLVQESERLAPGKGFAVVLDDPAGVAQDLALLMRRNHDLFVNKAELQRGAHIDGVLDQMELAIKQQGERARLMKAQRDAANMSNPGYMGGGDGGGAAAAGLALARAMNKKLDDSYTEIEEDIRNVPGPELDAAANEAWAKYAKKLDAPARKAWRDTFQSNLTAYDAKFIAPLALAHRDLMKHATLLNYFECNYDSADLRTGEMYAAVLGHCIATTSDKKACHDLYTGWLQGEVTDTANLLLQALTYHHKPTQEQVAAAASGATDWAGLPWDKVIEAFDKATGRLIEGSPDALGRLVGLIPGAIAASLIEAAKGQKVYAGLVALGAAARQPIVAVTITGGKKAFRGMLIKELLRLSGQNVNNNQMQRAVAEELRRLKLHGLPLEGTESKRWLLMIDPVEVRAMPQNLSPSARAQWLARNLKTPDDVEALNLHRFRAKVTGMSGTLRGGLPVAFGVLGVVANWVALDSLRDGERKAMAHSKSEGLRRIYAQGAQVIGAVAATIEAMLAKVPALGGAMARGVMSVSVKILSLVGKVFGAGGSLFMAVVDFWRAGQEFRQGDNVAAGLYLVSGGLGFAATLLLLFGFTGVGLIVVGLLIILSFVIASLVDNGLQDWIERCLWGRLRSERYPTLEKELAELHAATS